MDIDKALAGLDFQSKGMICETKKMLWLTTGKPLPSELRLAEIDPQGCQNRTTKMFFMRLCPCWSDPRKFVRHGEDFTEYTYVGGLLVSKIMLCAAHESYFKNYLTYPFLCPGCGVHFDSVAEILLDEQDTEEML
ncbi:hypothetical protein KNU02_gp61 [Gordonia phage Pleakley]|uniref:Uncharacterized protein n=1 Tax=Gordonia phage Pleakley TaxID=2283246 RepID=A0A345M6H9_9CAUD|nr:hypothetical protein KNU02_gp61 [Gordonia phage Pleakley]AXH49787.1 hypothetical protein SEA_FURY_61 [Gordonia phage Fury]AXH66100.1 hypothetical protein SEA_PLEAKLEY_61 [Gordonia phage Pleakley]